MWGYDIIYPSNNLLLDYLYSKYHFGFSGRMGRTDPPQVDGFYNAMSKAQKKKLLIIEDESSLSMILSDKFTREGFEVHEAKNGVEGLEKAQSQKPDLILLDIVMPTMDGISMIKKLRETKTEIPVLFLTNLSESERITEILGANQGVAGYLVKSHWQLDDLVNKVRETLKMS
jgi:DNA-binding response OmpR family regulator